MADEMPSEEVKSQYSHLGGILKRLRREKGLSLRDVSSAVGLSPGYLSQLENDRVGASFSTLIKVAHLYGLNLSELLRSLENQPLPIISRPGQRTASMRGEGYLIEWLVSETRVAMQVDMVVMEPGASSGGAYSHGGEEFAFVVSGNPTIAVGDQKHDLAPLELIYFKSESPHSWCNNGPTTATVFWCTTPPTV